MNFIWKKAIFLYNTSFMGRNGESMKKMHGIDMEKNQYSKLISEIPKPDIAISMGCNVGCPFIGRSFDDNWGLDDPTGKSDEEFEIVIKEIERKIIELKESIDQL